MNPPETFELKPEHILILRRMYVGWDHGEYGAPAIDCKRPYGNSDVAADVLEILGIIVHDGADISEADEALAAHWHAQTRTALQIVLATGSFEPGVYVHQNQYDGCSWRRIHPIMSDGPESHTLTMPGGGTVETTLQSYRGVLLSWTTGDGAELRAFVDDLSDDERLRLVGMQQGSVPPHEISTMMAIWRVLPPERLWTFGKPQPIDRFYLTVHVARIVADSEEQAGR